MWITSRTRVTRFDGGRAVSFASADFPAFARMTLSPYVQDVWWSQDESGLHVFLDGQEKRYLIDADVLRTGVTGVNRDRAGNVWVRTKGAGVVKIGGGRAERYTTRQGTAGR